MKKTLLFCAAFVAALPAFVLAANFCFYAFTGADFLPESSGYMAGARYIVFCCSAGLSAILFIRKGVA